MKIFYQIRKSICVYVGDIAQSDCDVIVNAANRYLAEGGGVCGAIFAAAGPGLQHELMKADTPLEDGDIYKTPGCYLKAKYIIHAVGPIYDQLHSKEEELASCYSKSIFEAAMTSMDSIAFPCISTGIYGYPKEEAARVASSAIVAAQKRLYNIGIKELKIYLCCFTQEDADIYEKAIDMEILWRKGGK